MPKAIITGVAGFIGCNTAQTLLREGWQVVGVDNLSRPGSDLNLSWLREQGFEHFHGLDITDAEACKSLLDEHKDAQTLIHLAGQVAVTSSVTDPVHDFRNNLVATLNLLEAIRLQAPDTQILFASTNKVYGGLEDHRWELQGERYILPDTPHGIDEATPLDFHSPYGCSKGAADQYVRDYHRIYGLKTTVLRQSCIYGYRQLGVEDQGWVAWFLIAAIFGKQITLFGDGCQVRDLLFIDDLVALYKACIVKPEACAGEVYNIGGGIENACSLREFFAIAREHGLPLDPTREDWRPGDQRYFVADTGKAHRELDWRPATPVKEGVARLIEWIKDNKPTLEQALNLSQKA